MTAAEIRGLAGEDDFLAAIRLGRLAFGADLSEPPDLAPFDLPFDRIGAFHGPRLAAKLTVIPYQQWFGGRAVPMGGVAGVAVAAEDRGTGLASELLATSLVGMRDRGEAISALFPTAVALYRRCGWELAGTLPRTRVRTADLLGASSAGAPGVTIRAAEPADRAGIDAAYALRARASNGLLTRTGPAFADDAGSLTRADGAPVAVRDGTIVGYASYTRGRGYRSESEITVDDLVVCDAGTAVALLHHLGRWASVAPHTTLRVLDDDPFAVVLPSALPAPFEQVRWMLRIVDAPSAIAARGWSAHVTASTELRLVDDQAPWNQGFWRLEADSGQAQLERVAGPSTATVASLHIRGLAALYSCAAPAAMVGAAGLLTDAGPGVIAALDAIFAGPKPAILDYF